MSKPAGTPLPGLIFYEVWSGVMRAQGRSINDFALKHGQTYQKIRQKACGAMNGPDAVEVRRKMMEEVGEDLFNQMYFERVRLVGAA